MTEPLPTALTCRMRFTASKPKSLKAAAKWTLDSTSTRRDRLTRKLRWEKLDTALEYEAKELDRSVVAKDQIRTGCSDF